MNLEMTEFSDCRPQDGVELWLSRNWSVPPETFEVEVEGAMIACRGWNLAAQELPLIVLVHGFRAHARWWDHLAPSLVARHRVVAMDLSGMGDSGRREAYARTQYGREILAVAESQGEPRPIVVAHSFGGVSAALAARAYPDRMRRLIVIDSAIPAPEDENKDMEIRMARYFPDRDSAVARFHLLPPGEWPQPAVLDYIAFHSVTETADGWSWKFDANSSRSLNAERYREQMFGIEVPVDMIYGEETEIMTPPRRAALKEMALNLGQEIVVPACHHHVLIEQPIALVAALNALLANERG